MLKDQIPALVKMVENHRKYLKYNYDLLMIYKGKLQPYVESALGASLSPETLKYALARIAPINVLTRIIDKKSKIYASGVSRECTSKSASDLEIFNYMDDQIKPNQLFSRMNAFSNLFKNSLVQPYLNSDGKPAARVIPSDRFIPFSDDELDPDSPTGYIIMMGSYPGDEKKGKHLYFAVNETDYVYFTEKKIDVTAEFVTSRSFDIYTHEFGAAPYVYVNRDPENLIPIQDTDIMAMSILIPVILTDINYAHMFQSFSIVYGVNLTEDGMKWGPNSFWRFKSDPSLEGQPQIGTITPTADVDAGLSLVANQFALWLNTKGIKPGAVGEVNGANFSTGIAKIMDEMDTSEDRNEQIPYFVKAERQFWDLVLKRMLPVWQRYQNYSGVRGSFSETESIITNFAEQVPLVRRGQLIDDCIKEIDHDLTTNERALKKLNPHMTQSELDQLKADIEAQKKARQAAQQQPTNEEPEDDENGDDESEQ